MSNQPQPNLDLTKENILKILDYDPESGLFTWKVARGRVAAGEVAGCMTDRGYILLRVYKKCIFAHRLAFIVMTGSLPKNNVDHIDGKRTNNAWANLRNATHSENSRNMGIPRTNKSGVIGVFWNNSKRKWTAKIKVCQKTKYLGDFDDLDMATKARKSAEQESGFHKNHGDEREKIPDSYPSKKRKTSDAIQ